VAQKLNLEHQICQFHVRRRVGRTLNELQYPPVVTPGGFDPHRTYS
jgi:hypothetical protein